MQPLGKKDGTWRRRAVCYRWKRIYLCQCAEQRMVITKVSYLEASKSWVLWRSHAFVYFLYFFLCQENRNKMFIRKKIFPRNTDNKPWKLTILDWCHFENGSVISNKAISRHITQLSFFEYSITYMCSTKTSHSLSHIWFGHIKLIFMRKRIKTYVFFRFTLSLLL